MLPVCTCFLWALSVPKYILTVLNPVSIHCFKSLFEIFCYFHLRLCVCMVGICMCRWVQMPTEARKGYWIVVGCEVLGTKLKVSIKVGRAQHWTISPVPSLSINYIWWRELQLTVFFKPIHLDLSHEQNSSRTTTTLKIVKENNGGYTDVLWAGLK